MRWLSLAASLLAACVPDGDPIVIGLAGPLSDPSGASARRGAALAIAEINRNGGVRSRDLALLARDDSAAPDVAIRAARELYEAPGVVAVIGHVTSDAAVAAAATYNGGDQPLVSISPSAPSQLLSTAGPYTFRICPDERAHAERLAEWAWNRLEARTAAVLYQNDAEGRGLHTHFARSFADLGGTVTAADPFVPNISSFEPYLRRLALGGGADVLVIAGSARGAARILPSLDSVALAPVVLGGDGLIGLESAGVNADGVLVSASYLHDLPGGRNQDFVAAFRQAYGDRLPDHRAAGAYDIVYLLAQAVEVVGPNRRRVQTYLAAVGTRRPAFAGVTGTISFDEYGGVAGKDVVIGVLRDRRFVTAPGQ